MPKIRFIHEGVVDDPIDVEASSGSSILECALRSGLVIEHACEMSCACTTCHVKVRRGFASLEEASDREEDLLDRAWGLESCSRLSCQARVAEDDLEVEIPRYTLNHTAPKGTE